MYTFDLPNGFTFEGHKVVKITIDEMTGKQQNYLVNTKYKSHLDHIEPLLTDLIMKVENDKAEEVQIDKKRLVNTLLSIEDLEFILIKLREITFGEDFFIEKYECPHCKAKNEIGIKLSALEVLPPKIENPLKNKLPKSGLEIEYKPIVLGILRRYASDYERLMNSATTSTISMALARLGDNENVTEADVEQLKAMDNMFIQKNAPGYKTIDTTIEHECHGCKKDFEYKLDPMNPDFFVLGLT